MAIFMQLKTMVKTKTRTATRVAIIVGIMVLFFAAGYGFVKFRPQAIVEKKATQLTPGAAMQERAISTGDVFIRGDADADGDLTIGDSIYILKYIFASGPAPSCLDAADVDDDGVFTIGDAVYLLKSLFAGGSLPPSPYPSCGQDPTADALPASQCVYLPCKPQTVGGPVPKIVASMKQEMPVIKPKTEHTVCKKDSSVFMGDVFIRGDVDSNGKIDALDSVFLLTYLENGPAPTCMDAADVNDDGKIDASDSVYLLTYIYKDGPQPPGPFESCGKDSAKADPWPAYKCVYPPCSCE